MNEKLIAPSSERPDRESQIEEKPHGSLFSRFIGGVIFLNLGSLSRTVFTLLATILVVRHLSAEEFGIFTLLGVVANFLAQLTGFGLDLSTTKFIAGSKDEHYKNQLVDSVVFFRLFTIVIIGLVSLFARNLLISFFGSSLSLNFAICIPFLYFLTSSRPLLNSILQGFEQFGKISLGDFIASFLNFILILIFVFMLGQGIFGLIYARLISESLSLTFLFLSIPTKKSLAINLITIKKILIFGFPLQLNDILTFGYRRADSLIIGVLLGPAAIAYYEVARRIPDSLATFYSAFKSVYYPLMSNLFALGEKEKAEKMLNASTRLISLVVTFGALISLVFGKEVIGLIFSEKYLPSVPVFVLLMVGLTFTFLQYTLGYSLVAIGDSNKPVIVNAALATVSLITNVLIIPVRGVLGAAIANVVGNAIAVPFSILFLAKRKISVQIWGFMKPILILGICSLVLLFPKADAILGKTLIISLFLLISIIWSVISREDMDIAKREFRLSINALKKSRIIRGKHGET
jgi:O-antigen/teichoic acid export membrane protein